MKYILEADTGEILVVTNMFRADGSETDVREEAVTLVAKINDNQWLSARIPNPEVIITVH